MLQNVAHRVALHYNMWQIVEHHVATFGKSMGTILQYVARHVALRCTMWLLHCTILQYLANQAALNCIFLQIRLQFVAICGINK